MTLKASLRFVLFLFSSLFFLSQAVTVSAVVKDYDPTQNYSVQAMPVLSTEPQVSIHSESESSVKSNSQLTAPLSIYQNAVENPSFFARVVDFSNSSLTFVRHAFGIGFDFAGKVVSAGVHIISDNASDWLLNIALFSMTSTIGFMLFNNEVFFTEIKIFFKTSTDLQIRLVGLVSAVVFSITTGIAWTVAYDQQLAFFEKYTGWRLNPLSQDLALAGGALILGLVFLHGGTIVMVVKSAMIASFTLLPSWKKILSYFAKETKTAFTETEKECENEINKCSSFFDKTVILLFNYLPGNMPDLGIDDAIINFKNSLFKSAATQQKINS